EDSHQHAPPRAGRVTRWLDRSSRRDSVDGDHARRAKRPALQKAGAGHPGDTEILPIADRQRLDDGALGPPAAPAQTLGLARARRRAAREEGRRLPLHRRLAAVRVEEPHEESAANTVAVLDRSPVRLGRVTDDRRQPEQPDDDQRRRAGCHASACSRVTRSARSLMITSTPRAASRRIVGSSLTVKTPTEIFARWAASTTAASQSE